MKTNSISPANNLRIHGLLRTIYEEDERKSERADTMRNAAHLLH